jgi:wyosine [tRNA(Phe)-imidazoG37] synthetase (radical SAM superfamily)
VDLVPHKTCTFDCIYCQLGSCGETTTKRDEYAPLEEVVKEVCERLEDIEPPDYVTLGGSGEPTLHEAFGEIARRIRNCIETPICLLTNGSLLHRPEVRADCRAIDLIVPSLDAPDAETYRRINRPDPAISFDMLVEGLVALRKEFEGRIWLEVFLLSGINDSDGHIEGFARLIERIQPDRVQLNTAARPPAEADANPVPPERMDQIRDILGPPAEVIARVEGHHHPPAPTVDEEAVVQMLRRRPCTLHDVALGLDVHENEVVKCLRCLVEDGRVETTRRDGKLFYRAE